jgi:hypothetical protein
MRMRTSVAAAWPAVCSRFEGRCWWMYLDVKFLVTTGLGILLETVEEAQSFLWLRVSDGQPATMEEIAAEYRRVKALRSLADNGGFAYKSSARLRLPEETIDDQLKLTTARFWAEFAEVHPDVDLWPADAQLAALDLCWQNGPKFTRAGGSWPNMRAAFHAEDWTRAAANVPGTHPRAPFRKRLFNNAAKVVEFDLDRDKLWNAETPTAPPPPATGDPILDMIRSLMLKPAITPATFYVTYQGEHFLPLDLEIILRCAAAVGWGPVTFIKGGLEDGGLSASTHAWFGAADLRTRDHTTAQTWDFAAALIRSGEAAFPRGYGRDSFAKHLHIASREAGMLAHKTLRAQIAEFQDGGDGLVGSKEYHGPSVRLGTWQQSPYNPVNITPDTGTYVVTTDGANLLGVDVDRKIVTRVPNGTEIDAVKRVQRWDRANVVANTPAGRETYFAADYLKPKEQA